MNRVLACSGLLVDAAWPSLGPAGGNARRATATQLLVDVVRSARDHDADAVVVLGGLCDATTVVPRTLATAASAFRAFDGPVWIVPGGRDAWTNDSPYNDVDWSDNTRVVRPGETVEWLEAGLHMAMPRVGWRGEFIPGADLVLLGGGEDLAADAVASSVRDATVLLGARQSALVDGVVAVGQLLPSVDVPSGSARLVTLSGGAVESVEDVDAWGRTIPIESIDLTGVASSEQLALSVAAAARALPPDGVVRLVGTLAVGVALPGNLDPEDVCPVALDLSSVSFAAAEGQAGTAAATTQAQFEVAVTGDPAPASTRHQAIALGLHGLAGTNR